MPLTATKTKLVTKKLHSAVNSMGIILWDEITKISNSENVKAEEVANLAAQLDYDVRRTAPAPVDDQPDETPAPPPEPVKSIPPKGVRAPSELIKRTIMQGGIYRQPGVDIDLQLRDDDFIVVRYGAWKKEREAIRNWIKSLGGDVPGADT